MDLERIKKLNLKLLETSSLKVEKAIEGKAWDCECFEVMAQAIDNMLDLHKIEHYSRQEPAVEALGVKETKSVGAPKQNVREDVTEFEQIIYDITEKREAKDALKAITATMAETMEDLRILHPRIYEMTIHRLKELR